MEMHNNLEVAALFRKMADIEGRHAAQIMAEMGWKEPPAMPRARRHGRVSRPRKRRRVTRSIT